MEKLRKDDGEMILELALVLPMFILLIMFVYGIFVIQSADNQITHALIQSTKSLALDAYANEEFEHASRAKGAESFWSSLGNAVLDFKRMSGDDYFSSPEKWYVTQNEDVVKRRFYGFFAGTESAAAEKLQDMNVIDGINGLNWNIKITDEDIKVEMSYNIQFWFDAFDLGKIPIKHKVVARLWK